MNKKTIVAVYSDLTLAREVVRNLQANDYQRGDIGLAVSDSERGTSGKAMVTVTVPVDDVDRIKQVMQFHHPENLDVRDSQWRMDGSTGFDPDEEDFVAVEIEEQRNGEQQ